jgi:hypothetical protein
MTMVLPETAQPASSFLSKIPVEIRNEVYELWFVNEPLELDAAPSPSSKAPASQILFVHRQAKVSDALNIQLTSRQTYHETEKWRVQSRLVPAYDSLVVRNGAGVSQALDLLLERRHRDKMPCFQLACWERLKQLIVYRQLDRPHGNPDVLKAMFQSFESVTLRTKLEVGPERFTALCAGGGGGFFPARARLAAAGWNALKSLSTYGLKIYVELDIVDIESGRDSRGGHSGTGNTVERGLDNQAAIEYDILVSLANPPRELKVLI